MRKMSQSQLNRLNKSISQEEKAYKAWKKAQKAIDAARRKYS
jgi:hypothetical protein